MIFNRAADDFIRARLVGGRGWGPDEKQEELHRGGIRWKKGIAHHAIHTAPPFALSFKLLRRVQINPFNLQEEINNVAINLCRENPLIWPTGRKCAVNKQNNAFKL